MIVILKNKVPYKEFFSVYNAITHFQELLSSHSEPTIVFNNDRTFFFALNEDDFEVILDTERQTNELYKWVDSFVYERPTTL